MVRRNAVLEAMVARSLSAPHTWQRALNATTGSATSSSWRQAEGRALLEVTRAELDRLTGGAVHQGIALQLPVDYAHPDDLLAAALDLTASHSSWRSTRSPTRAISGDREIGRRIWRARCADSGTPLGRHDRCRLEDVGRSGCSHPDCTGDQSQPQLARYADAGLSLIGLGPAADTSISDVPGSIGTGRADCRQ